MQITIQNRIGILLLLILGIVVGIAMLGGFALPTALVGIWLVVGCIIAIVGI